MKHHSYSSTLGVLAVLAVVVVLTSSMYLISSVITSTVTSVQPVAEVISAVSVFKLSPPSLSLVVTGDKTTFNNSVGVSLPGITNYPAGFLWPKWYVTNTAPWNTITYHYGKGQPNGYGPGTIEWTTNLTGYAPGTYTDTITLTSANYGSVTLIDTVQVLPTVTPPPPTTTPPPTSTGIPTIGTPPPPSTSSGAYKLTPSSVYLEIPLENAPFNNEVGVSLPGFTNYPWPAWYITNTAAWNTITYHYGKGIPNGYGPGTIQWTTNLAGYAPGTYTDTITLSSKSYLGGGNLSPVSFTDTVKVLPKGVPPVTTSIPIVTITASSTTGTVNVVNPSLTWSATNSPTACKASGDWTGAKAVSGTNVSQGVLTTAKMYTYTLTCANASGTSAPASATVIVTAVPPVTSLIPVVSITANPTVGTVNVVNPSLTWSATNYPTSCTASGDWTGTQVVRGTNVAQGVLTTVKIYTYTLTCTNANGTSAPKSATVYVGATPPPLSTLPPHPRVWMTPARITQLQAQVAANTVRWQKVKASADAQLLPSALVTNYGMLPNICLAYLGTGNTAYAQRAGVILTAATVTNSAATIAHARNDSAYYYGSVLPALTDGLDWCYNGLTVAERQETATWLMDAADWVWPETNPARIGAWAVNNVGDNYYWDFMTTGPAALASAGDDTGTGAISGSDRATYHINLTLSKWTNVIVPFLTSSIEGGADLEGSGYDISGRIAQLVDAFQTSNQTIQTPYLTQAMQWHMQYTTPDYKHFVPFGDQARVSDAPLYIYNRMSMLQDMTAANAGATINSQVQHWLTLIGQIPYSLTDSLIATELLNYNPSAPSVADFSSMPLSYLSQGAGDFIYRQSWTDPNTTMMAFESGTLAQSHQSNDANGLMIWKGSFWVSASANIYSYSGIVQDTSLFNNLTVGGLGQSHTSGTPQIVGTPQVSNSLVVVRGQAGTAYKTHPDYTGVSTVSNYLRTVSYLPSQDTFVIVDQATARDPSQQKVWWWQSKNPAVISGNTFTMANPAGDARCVGTVLLPTNATLAVVPQKYGYVRGTDLSSYAVTVTLPTGNATDVVVTTLQCSGIQPVTVSSDGTNINTTVGATHVTIPLNGAQSVTLY